MMLTSRRLPYHYILIMLMLVASCRNFCLYIFRIDMKNKSGNSAHVSYSTFYIGGSTTDYTLHVSGYSGTAGDYQSNLNDCFDTNWNAWHSLPFTEM